MGTSRGRPNFLFILIAGKPQLLGRRQEAAPALLWVSADPAVRRAWLRYGGQVCTASAFARVASADISQRCCSSPEALQEREDCPQRVPGAGGPRRDCRALVPARLRSRTTGSRHMCRRVTVP